MAKNEEPKTIYVVDLDNVMCDLDSFFYKLVYVVLGRQLDYEEFINRSTFSLEECGMLDPADLNRVIAAMEILGGYTSLDVFPGASELINGISKDGSKLVYLTSREPSNKVIKDTLEWFMRSKLAAPIVRSSLAISEIGSSTFEIVFEIDKSETLKTVKTGDKTKDMRIVYVEDDPQYVRMAGVVGVDKIYTFDYSYARELDPEDNILMVESPAAGGLLQIAENEGLKI